jgi:uncharacterized membrane protein
VYICDNGVWRETAKGEEGVCVGEWVGALSVYGWVLLLLLLVVVVVVVVVFVVVVAVVAVF